MRIKRSFSNHGHLKYPCIEPCLECFQSVSRTPIVGIEFFKMWEDPCGTINGPSSYYFMVRYAHEIYHFLVFVCN